MPNSPTRPPTVAPTRRALAAACLNVAACLMTLAAGCSSTPTPVPYARTYPPDLKQIATLDVQVYRSVHHIELTNTTARSFGPSTLWLNQWYSRPIDGFASGQTLRFPLSDFRDEFSDPIREGGFFATEKPEKVVLAQLETKEGDATILLGLIVIKGEEE